jgi:hypothetical protein
MTTARVPRKTPPWSKYRAKHGKLMQPGWAGELGQTELEELTAALVRDKELALWWGFKPSAIRRPERAIREVAMRGSPDDKAGNVRLVRRPRAP